METRWSICATRAVIIWSTSRPTVTEPSSTWATNSLTRFFPRSRALVSANRPCSTIWSRRLASVICSAATGAAAVFSGSGIGLLLLADLGLQLVELLRLAHGVKQSFIQLFICLQRALQVVQASPKLEQLPQWLYLPGHLLGLEVLQALEVQIHF